MKTRRKILRKTQRKLSKDRFNSYAGINMKCSYCHKNKGTHIHSLNNSKFNTKYNNIASSKHVCDFCKRNLGKLHIHLDYKNKNKNKNKNN